MATNKVSNPYIELFEQLPVPEKLEPQNIAAMLKERSALNALPDRSSVAVQPVKIRPSDDPDTQDVSPDRETRITVTSRKRATVAYRSIASVAACAALVLGFVAYSSIGKKLKTDDGVKDSAYATDYDDVHKSFEKYYIDDQNKTLDSAIADIEHSYNDKQNDSTQINLPDKPNEPVQSGDPAPDVPPLTAPSDAVTQPSGEQNQPPAPPAQTPDEPVTPPTDDTPPSEQVDDKLPLPEKNAVVDDSDILFGDGFVLRKESNMLRVFMTDAAGIRYTGNIFPIFEEHTAKALAGFYSFENKVVAVYSVERAKTVTASADPVISDGGQSTVDEVFDSIYTDQTAAAESRSTVEVCTYEIGLYGEPVLVSTAIQSGCLVDMNFLNGSLYLVTAYNDYRDNPIIGVDDLENYVPSYTVNGTKYFVSASDIMIPSYISTTDYTVISGISTDGQVSVKAVLGYEGRVLLRNGAVYLLGYDSKDGEDYTSVRVFSLSGGSVKYAGSVDIKGVALGGAGVSTFNGGIAVTTVKMTEQGYVTTLGTYDPTMNLIFSADIPGALTSARREGNCLYLSGAKDSCGYDLSDLAHPVLIENAPEKDRTEGLMALGDGYVTLTKTPSGELRLSKLIKNAAGELTLAYTETVCTNPTAESKALDNNGILFVSGDVVGVPYGWFDGLDNCYRYALYRAADGGFIPMGFVETHETEEAFEPGKARLKNGTLYVFSEGRVSALVVGDSVSLIGRADIIESSYGGH